jgi:hypothetical protein
MPIVDRSLEAHREDYTNVQWRASVKRRDGL